MFPAFIAGNATRCNAVVEPGSHKGKSVTICGAGPTLADHIADFQDADEVWGCNSALIWLKDQGYRVTHGFTVDQTAHMCEEWATTPDVPYMIASSVHPHLVELLESAGREITFFHNYVGIDMPPVAYGVCQKCDAMVDTGVEECPCGSKDIDQRMMDYEDWMYATLYPTTARAGAGLNTASRAVDIAIAMGFDTINILGADCCLRHTRINKDPVGSPSHTEWLKTDVIMHVDGSNALRSGATALTMQAEIDGRTWVTKPDMAITAVWLAEMAQAWPERLNFVGDTLVNAIKGKTADFFDRLPALTDSKGRRIRYTPTDSV
jgi:hypothetical protein